MGRGLGVAVTVLFFFSCALWAQTPTASVTGQVTDASKAVIPEVKVVLINLGTNLSYEGMTNGSGSYSVATLPAGTYSVRIEKPGFETFLKPVIVLLVGDVLELNFEMAVGSESRTVTVQAEPTTVQLATSSISDVVNSTSVVELPLNGRSWTDLATLSPGVNAVQTQPDFTIVAARAGRGYGAQISISGVRPQQNNYRLDGVSINDYANGAPGNVLGANLGVDAIQEFSVLTASYDASYGKTAGGVVNAVTRSGTNQFHGNVYEFLRNSALDARNYFDLGGVPPFKRNQFGGSIGGPILTDRTFFFVDYEGLRQSQGVSVLDVVPSLTARAGNLCSNPGTPPTCTPTTVTVNPAAQKYLTFYPMPNGAVLGNGDTALFTFASNQVVNENFVTARIDHKFSGRDSISGTWMYDNTPFSFPDSLDQVLLGDQTKRQVVAVQETHIFSSNLINTVRFGFNHVDAVANNGFSALNPAADDKSLGANAGFNAALVSIGGGITPFTGGLGSDSPFLIGWNSYQVYDDALYTHGKHSLKFGFAFERDPYSRFSETAPGGQFFFSSLQNFLTNVPSKFQGTNPATLPTFGFRQSLFGGYLQDDWRVRSNLTVNLGLRYEMVTVPSEVQNRLANLVDLTSPTIRLGQQFSNPTLRNFEPRVGFAWDPFKDGRTAVRGGFGMFDSLPMLYIFAQADAQTAPFSILVATTPPPGSFFTAPSFASNLNKTTANFIAPPRRSYVMQWNLDVQRQLAPTLTASLAYVGSRGVHLVWAVDDADIVLPTLTPAGFLWPATPGSAPTLNPNFGAIKSKFWNSNSFYDALELNVIKRMGHGVQVQGAYTWGRSIDNSSASQAGDQFFNAPSSPDYFDPRLTRGLSDFNQSQVFVANAIWQVPFGRSLEGPAGWLLANGWELGGIYKASSGVPFSATFGTNGDPLGKDSSDPWDFPNRLAGQGCQSLVNPGQPRNYIKTQCFAIPTAPSAAFYAANCNQALGTAPQCFNLLGNAGRNILIGPGLSNFDFFVYKNNYVKRISEGFDVQFRVEIFNILNHANFAVPSTPGNTDIFNADGSPNSAAGLLTSTTTSARQIQFGLKVIW